MNKGFKRLMAFALAGTLSVGGALTVCASAIPEPWSKQNGICYNDQGQVIEGALLKGIDVSGWQEKIDWKAVKNDGIDFAFIRVGHGGEPKDTWYDYNMEHATAEDIPVGVYYYSRAMSEEESIRDAQFVIENLDGYEVSYPVVVDMEDQGENDGIGQLALTTEERTNIAIAFCEEIKSAGYYPMVYCNENWYKNYLDMSRLKQYDKWVARYQSTYDTNIPREVWQCTSKGSVNGVDGNTDIDFAFVDYSTIITPRTTPDSSYVPRKGQWRENEKGKWYERFDGTYPSNGWERVDGSWYYFDRNGYIQTGWVLAGGSWYYLAEDGIMQTGWIDDRGTWYYADGSGVMQTGWLNLGGTWYYLNGNGSMATGWMLLGGKWYYLDRNGAMAAGWVYVNDTWYYLNGSGAMITGWLDINGTWYYLNESGAMQTGWILVGGKWYYLNEKGAMAVNTWIGSYYVDGRGVWVQ